VPAIGADFPTEAEGFQTHAAGAKCAPADSVRNFEDLVCWQLAYALKCEVFEFTSKDPAARDFKYRDQIRASSASAHSNIAEGFGYFRPADFARFLGYAIASLVETRNHLIDGSDRNYLERKLFSRLMNLTDVAKQATRNLMLSKQRQAAEERERQKRDRQPRKRPDPQR
jgi:four helix bundle protein